MARAKQYVFSARTTEEGLKALNQVKERVNMGWDEFVIEAVSAHYEIDKAVMTLPKKEKPASEAQVAEGQTPVEPVTGPVPAEQRATEPEQVSQTETTPNKKQTKKNKK